MLYRLNRNALCRFCGFILILLAVRLQPGEATLYDVDGLSSSEVVAFSFQASRALLRRSFLRPVFAKPTAFISQHRPRYKKGEAFTRDTYKKPRLASFPEYSSWSEKKPLRKKWKWNKNEPNQSFDSPIISKTSAPWDAYVAVLSNKTITSDEALPLNSKSGVLYRSTSTSSTTDTYAFMKKKGNNSEYDRQLQLDILQEEQLKRQIQSRGRDGGMSKYM